MAIQELWDMGKITPKMNKNLAMNMMNWLASEEARARHAALQINDDIGHIGLTQHARAVCHRHLQRACAQCDDHRLPEARRGPGPARRARRDALRQALASGA